MLDDDTIIYKESSTDVDVHVKLCESPLDTRRPSTCPQNMCKFIVLLPSVSFPLLEQDFKGVDAVWTNTFIASQQLLSSLGMDAAVIPRSTVCQSNPRKMLVRDSLGIPQDIFTFVLDASDDDIGFESKTDLITVWCSALHILDGAILVINLPEETLSDISKVIRTVTARDFPACGDSFLSFTRLTFTTLLDIADVLIDVSFENDGRKALLAATRKVQTLVAAVGNSNQYLGLELVHVVDVLHQSRVSASDTDFLWTETRERGRVGYQYKLCKNSIVDRLLQARKQAQSDAVNFAHQFACSNFNPLVVAKLIKHELKRMVSQQLLVRIPDVATFEARLLAEIYP